VIQDPEGEMKIVACGTLLGILVCWCFMKKMNVSMVYDGQRKLKRTVSHNYVAKEFSFHYRALF